jgi:hypothetical protein
VGSGKWEVGSGKWEVGSGKWEVGSGKWEVGSGKWEVPCTLIGMASVFTCGDECGAQSSVLRAWDLDRGVGSGVLPADCRPAAQDLPRLRLAVNMGTTAANPAIPACKASSTSPG